MERDLSGPWFNQHHSVLHLVQEGRRLSGTFRPGVGPLKEQSFPLLGFVLGDQVGFVVAFGPGAAVTAWVGHLVTEGIETLWQMSVRVDAAGRDDDWRGTWSGADLFRRGEPALVRVGDAGEPAIDELRLPSVPVRVD
jgi:hypothetical protein